MCLSKNEEEIDAIAKKWASVLSDKIAREKAEEAARILLRHGITDLPQLKETGRIGKRVVAQFFSGDTPKIEVNKKLTADDWARNTRAVQTGWATQDNPILHECGHYVDYICNKEKYEKRSENSRFFGDIKVLLENKVSKYAATDQWELEAELYAGVMRGKVYPNEVLNLSRISQSDNDITKRILSYASGEDVCLPSEDISKGFKDAMKVIFNQKGSSFSIDIMADKNVQSLIEAHATVLDRNLQRVEMSDIMRQRLQRSNYIFSGIKTFHELNEAFPSLLDENGNRKPFERFLNDVQTIDDTYNRGYLRAEYNFVQSSAQMAAKWKQFSEDGDRYNLQYRTAGDDKVRPAHAALNGVTLPPSDPFWQTYYPPNGWNCRCTVVQVRKSKYPVTPHDEAMKRGEEALQDDTKGIFHFNPGIQQKTMPDYNPYTIRRCRDCDIAKGKIKLARFVPENELCAACKLVRSIEQNKIDTEVSRSKINTAKKSLVNWYKENLPVGTLGKFIAKRFEVSASDGTNIIIKRSFYDESISKYQDDPMYPLKLEYAKKAHELIKTATLVDPNEKSIDHPGAYFKVYEIVDDCYKVEMKVKCNRDGNYMHILRVYKKSNDPSPSSCVSR